MAPLLPAEAGPGEVLLGMDPRSGAEREVAVLFADLRGFTRISERRLPYDTVFVLNRYFEAMGTAIERAGGRVDKFIGDGIMALFGLARRARSGGAGRPRRRAADGARRWSGSTASWRAELDEPLRMGIGLHLGPAIIGEMGWGRAASLTAIGDTVNVASRLEALTKELGVQLVVSERLARRAGVGLDDLPAARDRPARALGQDRGAAGGGPGDAAGAAGDAGRARRAMVAPGAAAARSG